MNPQLFADHLLLLAAGEPATDPRIQKAIKFLEQADITGGYATGLRAYLMRQHLILMMVGWLFVGGGRANGLTPDDAGESVTCGEVVGDFTPESIGTSWSNHAVGLDSVGPLMRFDKRPLLREIIPGPTGAPVATVRLDSNAPGAGLRSEKIVPSLITGDGSAPVEAWIFAAAPTAADATVVSYGVRQRGEQRQFLYGTRKPMSGYFSDLGDWGSFKPDAMRWHFLIWVCDHDSYVMTAYVDGTRASSATVDLNTDPSPLVVGIGPSENFPGDYDNDPIDAYVAAIRVQNGCALDR